MQTKKIKKREMSEEIKKRKRLLGKGIWKRKKLKKKISAKNEIKKWDKSG